MDYIQLNDNTTLIPYPNDFQMTKTPNIVNEMTTMAGNIVADVNGWKWSDTTLSWDYLPEELLQIVLEETDPILKGTFTLGVYDPQNGTTRQKWTAFRTSFVSTKTRMHDEDGNIIWTGVEMSIRFPDSL